ncbi:MAG: MBL fold metallo-hydrolase, partial [Vicinamibacterales bacterium]
FMFRRFFDEGLAQTSYLIACERTRQAAIIDPRRDVDGYVAAAGQHGLSITHAIETHVHADFVSGARELATLGASTVAGPGAGLTYALEAYTEAIDGQTLRLGDVELTFLHTPGHTPEHISVLARQPDAPVRLFTGDTLFVGAVGRPDLLGESMMRDLADKLYDSLFKRLLALPDDVQVHPGHGAGSLCGAGIGNDPHSTIGQERRFNPLLQYDSREAFRSAVLADLPDTPTYFARMKRVNREGPPLLGLSREIEPPPPVIASAAADGVAGGAWLLDLRPAAAYGAGHPAGAINMAFGPKLGYWAGWLIPADVPIFLMGDGGAGQAADARRQLLRVGLDSVAGHVDGGFAAWRGAGLPVHQLEQISAAELRARHLLPGEIALIDVRSHREWRIDHVPGALHIPLGELASRTAGVPRGGVVATMCEGGYRSSLAASLLERDGVGNLVNVVGGMNAWRLVERART